jgi:PAS domain S-box-containing protein
MLGFDLNEMVGQRLHVLTHHTKANGEPYPPEECPIYRAFKDGLTHQAADELFWRKDGMSFPVEYTSTPVREGEQLAGAVVTFKDITERKRAEEDVKLKAELLDAGTDSIFLHDPAGKFLYVNEASYRTRGYTREEFLALNLHDLDVPEYASRIEPRIAEMLRTGEATFESAQFRRDGSVMPVEVHARMLEVDGRKLILSVVRDITERKRAETALRETSAYLDNLITYANAPIIVWDASFRITRFNRAFERLTGQKESDVKDQTLSFLFPADQREHSLSLIHRTSTGERWETVEIPIQHVDGSVFTVLWNSATLYTPDGSVLATIAQGQDITERKLAEAALSESELKFRAVFESSNDALMLLDSEQFLDCNSATLRVFGYSNRDAFLGKHPGEVSPPLQADGRESRVAADENIAAAFRDGRNFFEWLHQRADGTIFPADVLLTPLDYHGRKVLQATVRDITPRKIAEVEIAQKNAELAKLNELKNQLLGMAAHDLRNPLSVVNTASAFLLDDASRLLSEEKKHDFMRRINANGEFMLKLIDNLLDVAKIESGRLDLELATGDLCGLIEENLTMNRMLAEKKGIRLDYAPECGMPLFRFDRGKVEQVLNNLISNALKFSAPGTAVTVQASRVKDSVVVSVRDQGQGIPAEELDKLFKPFGKTSVRSTAGERSTGLGLAICRKIVEGHGGRIWAESEIGKGSVFSFSLPVATDDKP